MESKMIDPTLFQKKFPSIDFKTLELKPHSNLKFCSCPNPPKTYEPEIDKRYLENDSRYITPEDLEKYHQEFEEIQRYNQIQYEEYLTSDIIDVQNINSNLEHGEEDIFVEDNEDENDEHEQSDYEDEVDEYEFRTVKK